MYTPMHFCLTNTPERDQHLDAADPASQSGSNVMIGILAAILQICTIAGMVVE